MTTFDPLGLMDFDALHSRTAADDYIAEWAFDLLFHDGGNLRKPPSVKRKDLLMVLIMGDDEGLPAVLHMPMGDQW